jgi:hypothetical protein
MNIRNFFDFILENYKKIEVPFQFCQEFDMILSNIQSPISYEIKKMRLKPYEISLLNVGDESDMISFTTSQKLSQHFNTKDQRQLNLLIQPLTRNVEIYHKNRTNIKVGRLIKKLFGSKFNDSEIEKFVNQYKSIMDRRISNFEIWESNKIINGYSSINYTYDGISSNPLLNSCMNDQFNLIEFYKYVPVKLLVLINVDGHILGRALIWKTDNGNFMDRVYSSTDHDYYKFIEYAKKNNIIYKVENKSGSSVKYVKDGNINWFQMEVNLKFNIEDFNNGEKVVDIPYMDTFIYGQNNKLTNYKPLNGKYYLLTDTDGEPLEVIPQYDVDGQIIDPDRIEYYDWSNTQNGWVYRKSGTFVNSVMDFLSLDYLNDPENGFIFNEKDGWIKIKI